MEGKILIDGDCSSAAGWDQSVQSIFRTAQATPSYEQLLEKQVRRIDG